MTQKPGEFSDSVLLEDYGDIPTSASTVPMLENFPTDNPAADARRFNELIEAQVRRVPAQYLWIHRRFKGLTPDYPNYYKL